MTPELADAFRDSDGFLFHMTSRWEGWERQIICVRVGVGHMMAAGIGAPWDYVVQAVAREHRCLHN